MSTHKAVVTIATRSPLAVIGVPTIEPVGREVLVHVEWTASTPLDLHQNDSGLLVKHPQVLGDGIAGTVVKAGPDVKKLAIGDKVFGFGFREQKEKAHQEYATFAETLLGKIPDGFKPQEAVTLPNNVVTIFHTVTTDFKLPLPWPIPADPPAAAESPILIWGAGSSCGQYALQILSHWGYKNLIATASVSHHELLKSFGARHVFDYRDPRVTDIVLQASRKERPAVPYILDCIASQSATMKPISKIAQSGTKVAILLPVILKDASEEEAPEYTFDVEMTADWAEGVEPRGVRTHFYMENKFFEEHLQSEIIPTLLAQGVVKPNRQKVVEGETMLKRAQTAMDMLRRKEASGERLVWQVSDL